MAVRRVPSVPSQDRTATLAKGGDAQAQLQIGLRDLAKNDTTDAAPWLERAAFQGVPVAQYRVATLYAAGRGVPADKVKAFRWYLAAAQAGNRKAMSNLAVAYAQGEGTAKNPQEARDVAEKILALHIKGLPVQRLLVTPAADIAREATSQPKVSQFVARAFLLAVSEIPPPRRS